MMVEVEQEISADKRFKSLIHNGNTRMESARQPRLSL
jgi:hypothetical protein